jgi:hypothetical protein
MKCEQFQKGMIDGLARENAVRANDVQKRATRVGQISQHLAQRLQLANDLHIRLERLPAEPPARGLGVYPNSVSPESAIFVGRLIAHRKHAMD